MAHPERKALRDFVRLVARARPYLWVVGVSLIFAWLYGAGLSGRAFLLKPIVDDVVVPSLSFGDLDELLAESEAGADSAQEEERGFLRQRVQDSFLQIAIAGLAIIIGMPLARLGRDYATQWLVLRLLTDLQLDLGKKLLRLPLAHHVREGRGDFVSRLSSDTAVASRVQIIVFSDIIEQSGVVVIALAMAFYVSWQLALVLLLVGPLVALVLGRFGRRIRRSSLRRQQHVSEVTQRVVQLLSGIKEIKAFHAEASEEQAFGSALRRYFSRAMKVVRNRVLARSIVELVTQLAFVGVLLLGVWAILQNHFELTLGKLTAFAFISSMLNRPLRNMASIYNGIQDALPAAGRIFEVFDAAEVSPDPPGAKPLESVRGRVRYEDVAFSYGREPVIDGVTLELAAGEVVALVGSSGAGKTTLADLLLRFYEPERGRVTIDGHDLREVARSSLHEALAVVTQEPFLFDDTVRANIAFGRPAASDDEIVKAAQAANAHGFISELPEGYETPVGDVGGQLSGGQRQRIAIARAILRDPQILIFDEATSALDAMAEQQVRQAITNLLRGRTVLLIAHRLSTVKSADRIAVLDGGRISMTGTHDELLARGGLYRELVDAQLTPDETAA